MKERDYPERLTGSDDYYGIAALGAYELARRTRMDWTKLLDIGMVQSAVRWLLVAWGSSTFMSDWTAGNPTEWNAIIAGGVALVSLIWSFMTVKANK